jgi:hypothetical protein
VGYFEEVIVAAGREVRKKKIQEILSATMVNQR